MAPAPPLLNLNTLPTTFDALPLAQQCSLYQQVAALEAQLRAKLLTRHQPHPAAPDRAVRIEEAAGLLGMTKDYIYRHWRKLGGYRDEDGHVKFATSTIQNRIRQR